MQFLMQSPRPFQANKANEVNQPVGESDPQRQLAEKEREAVRLKTERQPIKRIIGFWRGGLKRIILPAGLLISLLPKASSAQSA